MTTYKTFESSCGMRETKLFERLMGEAPGIWRRLIEPVICAMFVARFRISPRKVRSCRTPKRKAMEDMITRIRTTTRRISFNFSPIWEEKNFISGVLKKRLMEQLKRYS